MPDPVPVVLLGRLAVDRAFTSQGIGAGLWKDAFLRVAQAAAQIGVRALLIQAIDEDARCFYLEHGFYDSDQRDDSDADRYRDSEDYHRTERLRENTGSVWGNFIITLFIPLRSPLYLPMISSLPSGHLF